MPARPDDRDRPETEAAVLEALRDRGDDGMTVLEVRAAVQVEIDELEEALTALKSDDLLVVEEREGTALLKPAEDVLEDDGDAGASLGEWLRDRIPL